VARSGFPQFRARGLPAREIELRRIDVHGDDASRAASVRPLA